MDFILSLLKSSQAIFLTLAFILVIVLAAFVIGVGDLKDWSKSKDGKQALKGIRMALTFCVVVVLVSLVTGCSQGTFFNDVRAFAGLESTLKPSPMCIESSTDNRWTSNLGVKANIYETNDERLRVNTQYIHHSCAFGVDDRDYDAIGLEAEYKIWSRKR